MRKATAITITILLAAILGAMVVQLLAAGGA